MNTVITKGNNVRQYDPDEAILCMSDIADCIAVNSNGKVIVNEGNPITWPTAATNGLQAIVDVKAGTLRFAYDGWPRAQTEFVVSEYVAPAESLKPESVQHILDLIEYWPSGNPAHVGFRPAPQLPTGFSWIPQPIHWLLGVTGSPKTYDRDDWFKYQDKQVTSREEVIELVHTWPIHLERNGEKITEDWVWGGLNGITVIVNQSTGKTITENDWREHLVEILRKNTTVETVTAASMLTAALGHMEDRAKTYDTPGGERSMGKTVAAFNVITGLELTEEQGWLFMEILKQVRSQQGDYRPDNYEDMVAYAALRGECAARERGNK